MFRKFLVVSTILITSIFGFQGVRAADLKIAVVDLQQALNDSAEGKKAMSALEADKSAKSKQLESMKTEITNMRNELEKQKDSLTKEVLQQKANDLINKSGELQKKASEFEQQLKKKEIEATRRIISGLRMVVSDVAKDKGLDLVLENSADIVLYAPSAVDITPDVIKAYNANPPKVESGKKDKDKKGNK